MTWLFLLPGFISHLTQVLLNTDTSLISVIISKTEKKRVHSQNTSMGFGKILTMTTLEGGNDLVYLPNYYLCWSPFILWFRKQVRQFKLPQANPPIYLHHKWASATTWLRGKVAWVSWVWVRSPSCDWPDRPLDATGVLLMWDGKRPRAVPRIFLQLHRSDLLPASSSHPADGVLLFSGHCCSGNDRLIPTQDHSLGAAWGKLNKFSTSSLDTYLWDSWNWSHLILTYQEATDFLELFCFLKYSACISCNEFGNVGNGIRVFVPWGNTGANRPT